MKRFSRIFVSLMLAIVMILSVGMLAACSEEQANNGGNDTPTTSDNQGGGGNSTEPEPEPYVYKEEDRSEYSVMNAANAYLDASIYDLITTGASEDGILSYLNGYRFGDVYDIAVSAMMSNMAEGSDLPTESITALQFTRGTDGNWYNFYKSPVHPILNKFLNFELNGKGDLGLTLAELETYTDTSLVYLVKWSMTNSTTGGNETINSFVEQMIDGMVAQLDGNAIAATLNANVSDLAMLFEGKSEGFLNIYGDMTLAGLVASENVIPMPYANWTVRQYYAFFSDDEETILDTFGEFTLADLTAFMGYEVPEDSKFYEQYSSMTVAEYYAMVKLAQYAMNVAMYGSEEEVYEAFGGEEYVIANFLAQFMEVEPDATPAAFYEYTVADFIMACRAEDAALEEMGYEEYSMMMLEKAWGEVKDYTLGEICAMFEVELPEEYGEYAELSLEQVYEMILAAMQTPEEAEPMPKSIVYLAAVEEEITEEGEGMSPEEFYEFLSNFVLLENTYEYYSEEAQDYVEVTEYLYAIDVYSWIGELYYMLSESQADGYSLEAAFGAWYDFLDYNDNQISYWLSVLDRQCGFEEAMIVRSAPVAEYEDNEGDGYGYDDDDYYYEDYSPFERFMMAWSQLSYSRRYEIVKMAIDEAYGYYGMMFELTFADFLERATGKTLYFIKYGNERLDAVGALLEKYYGYTLIEYYLKYEEMGAELGQAFSALTIYDVIQMFTPTDSQQGPVEEGEPDEEHGYEEGEASVPECITDFLAVYGEYSFADIANMTGAEMDDFVAALCALYDGLSDIAAEEIELKYDFGNEAVNKFVKKMMLYNANDVTNPQIVMEALKDVTLKDVLMAGMKVYGDVYAYIQEMNKHEYYSDLKDPTGNTYYYDGYGAYGEAPNGELEQFYDNVVSFRTQTYFSFYNGTVYYYIDENTAMSGTYYLDSNEIVMTFTTRYSGNDTTETHVVSRADYFEEYFELVSQSGDGYWFYIRYSCDFEGYVE